MRKGDSALNFGGGGGAGWPSGRLTGGDMGADFARAPGAAAAGEAVDALGAGLTALTVALGGGAGADFFEAGGAALTGLDLGGTGPPGADFGSGATRGLGRGTPPAAGAGLGGGTGSGTGLRPRASRR